MRRRRRKFSSGAGPKPCSTRPLIACARNTRPQAKAASLKCSSISNLASKRRSPTPKPRPNSNSSPEGTYLIYPSLGGGTNFQAPSYSALTGWFYLAFSESGQQFASAPATVTRGQQYIGRGRGGTPAGRAAADPEPNAGIEALDPETGKTVWQFPIFQGSLNNGVMATAGNIVFASSADGNLFALDSKTGKHLWHFQTNARHSASPMSYSIDGKQYVAISAGNVIIAFSLAE